MGLDSGFRSLGFITLSSLCHGACVVALALAPGSGLGPSGDDSIQLSMGDESATHGRDSKGADIQEKATPEPSVKKSIATPAAKVAPPQKKSVPTQTDSAPSKKIVKNVDLSKKEKAKEKALPGLTSTTPEKEVAQESSDKGKQLPEDETESKEAVVETEDVSTEVSEQDVKSAKDESSEEVAAKEEVRSTPEESEESKDSTVPAEVAAETTSAETTSDSSNREDTSDSNTAAAEDKADDKTDRTEDSTSNSRNDSSEGAGGADSSSQDGAGSPATEPTTNEGLNQTRSYMELKQKPGNRTPDYPVQARRENRQGDVDLLYFVNKAGQVEQIKVLKSSGSKDLDEEAVRTISQYRYVSGQEGWTRHPVIFSLKGQAEQLPSRLRTMGAQGN